MKKTDLPASTILKSQNQESTSSNSSELSRFEETIHDRPKAASPPYWRFILGYAGRNLLRQRRRTFLTLLTVGFAGTVAIVANRYTQAVMKLWQDGAADTGTGHAQIHAPGYWQKQEGVQVDLTLNEESIVEKMLADDPSVLAISRRLEIEGIVSTGDESVYFMGQGVDGDAESLVSPRLFTTNDDGQFVKEQDPTGVVVGKGLADSLSLKIGSEITLIAATLQGSVNGVDARVIGIVDAAIPSFSKRLVIAPIALFQKLIRMPDRYTELAIRLKPNIVSDLWVGLKRSRYAKAGVELLGWFEIEPVIRNVGRIWENVVLIITLLLFISAALSVLNVVLMAVAERTIEFGTLGAIGARASDIQGLVAWEAMILGVLGGGSGVLFGNLVVLGMQWIGVQFESPFGSEVLVIYPQPSLIVSVLVLISAVVVCLLAGISPARRASRVEPVKAFRGQLT